MSFQVTCPECGTVNPVGDVRPVLCQHCGRIILVTADLFCGAGGTSTGAELAIRERGASVVMTCVNHWPLAIETHKANHPTARHYIEDLTKASARDLVEEGYLDLLMASPECTHFSRARGGKPVNDQSRMKARAIIQWLRELDVRCVLAENVPEFVDWGPIDPVTGKLIPHLKGTYFQNWIQAFWSLHYTVEWRILNAADFGDATTRRRFFLIARKDGINIQWPEPTHGKPGRGNLLGKRRPWRAAREIIDWDNAGRSLLDDPKYKKRPLSVNTRRRIARGLAKYGGAFAPLYINLLGLDGDEAGGAGTPDGFTIANRNHSTARGMDEPVHTVTAGNGGGGLCRVQPIAIPFILNRHGDNGGDRSHDLDDPTPTADTRGAGYLVDPKAEAFILGQQSCSAPRNTDEPIPTVATDGAISLVKPQIVVYHGKSGTQPLDRPLPSMPTHSHHGFVEPQLVKYYGTKKDTQPVDQPLDTITTKDRYALAEPTAEPFIVPTGRGERPGQAPRVRGVDEPVQSVTTRKSASVVEPTAEPFIVQNRYGLPEEDRAPHDLDDPFPTVTSHGAGSLVDPMLIQVNHGDGDADNRIQTIEEPLKTLTSHRNEAIVEAILVPYGPRAEARGANQPLPTILTRDRLGLARAVLLQTDQTGAHGACTWPADQPLRTLTTKANTAIAIPDLRTPDGAPIDPRRLVVVDDVLHILDIRFRMLTNHELARAMSFDDAETEYEFLGTIAEVTKQIGNAVPVRTAAALVGAILDAQNN